jgi:hypothetical protein
MQFLHLFLPDVIGDDLSLLMAFSRGSEFHPISPALTLARIQIISSA